MGWLLLGGLTVLAALAAVAITLRTEPEGRAELALTATTVWSALIALPVYALGFTNHLSRAPLALTAAGVFLVALVLAGWRGSFARSAAAIAEACVLIVFLPFDAIGRAARAKSLVVVALVFVGLLIPYMTLTAYLSPSWKEWDAIWYHEPIIGFAIQNHGFAVVPLPDDLQKINGYPRICEMIDLWFVIFTDRRLIEVASSLMAPGLLYATYVIARRYLRDPILSAGFALVVILMPTTWHLLASTYIDNQVAFFLVAGTHYATRPAFRPQDAWLAAVCVTLAVGSKVLALPAAGILAMIALVRLLAHQGLTSSTLATALGGASMITSMAFSIYGRNWARFKNPLWPDLAYDNPERGIHLPSINYSPESPFDMNMPPKALLDALLAAPYSNMSFGHKGQLYDYGFGVIWIVLPIAAIGLCVALVLTMRNGLAVALDIPEWHAPLAPNALLVAFPALISAYLSPALWGPRYLIANVAAALCMAAFLGGLRGWHRLAEGAAVAACLSGIIMFFWTEPRWWWSPTELEKLADIPYPEREVTPAATISTGVGRWAGSAMTREAGLERETMGPNDIIVFGDNAAFVGLLWNNTFSNKVVWVPSGPSFFRDADAVGATWVVCRRPDTSCVPGPDSGWEDVGGYHVEGWGRFYRRKNWMHGS